MAIGHWEESVHLTDQQFNRRQRALTEKMSITFIDKKRCTATIENSQGNTWYHVTLDSCTCPDFSERQLPCKHIYKLAFALGLSEFDDRISDKSKKTGLLCCIFGGWLGIHYFYVGRVGIGFLYLFTMGLFCFGWFYDIYRIASGKFKDSRGRYVRNNQ